MYLIDSTSTKMWSELSFISAYERKGKIAFWHCYRQTIPICGERQV